MTTSILQILKVNEPRSWAFEGKTGFSHSAECLLLSDDGAVDQVGVLRIKGETMIAKAKPGTYFATFALRSNPASRAIEAVLVDLQPVRKSGSGFAPVEAAKAA